MTSSCSSRSCCARSSRTRLSIAVELLGGVHAVGGVVLRLDPGVQLLLQSGDPHLEEFVEVAAENGEELEALEQRVGGVRGFFQHARVELEPGQLAVQVVIRRKRGNVGLGHGR